VTWVIVAILAVVVVVLAVLLLRARRSQQLQDDFGPEYGRVVAERGDRRKAESELASRRERRSKLEIRELEPAAREQYAERWAAAQRAFVDQPAPAVAQADELVSEVMRDRGYPVSEDFDQRAADISVDHPVVVEHYRAARAISISATEGRADTEDLREAMVHFRALFAALLGGDDRVAVHNTSNERTTDGTP
jgi:hypothetical protein